MEVEAMKPELVADLDRMLALNPSQIIDELPAIDGFEAIPDPLHSQLGVRDVAGERDIRRPGGLVHDAALILSPQPVGPIETRCEGAARHVPSVPGNGAVKHQVAADDVVELLRSMVSGDSLDKAITEIIGVLLRVERRRATQHFAAVTNCGTGWPVETGRFLEL